MIKSEKFIEYEDSNWKLVFSSKGMGIKSAVLKKYFDKNKSTKTFNLKAKNGLFFETKIKNLKKKLDFEIKKVGDNQLVGIANYQGMKIKKTILINSSTYSLDTSVSVTNISDFFTGISNTLVTDLDRSLSASLFTGQFNTQQIYVLYNGSQEDEERIVIQAKDVEEEAGNLQEQHSFNKVNLAAVGTQYFTQAFIDKSKVIPEVKATVDHEKNIISSQINHNILSDVDEFSINYVSFVGPKDMDILNKLDSRASGIIDFGWFSFIGKYILKFLKVFYKATQNWGIAVVLLTLVVRLLLLPLTIASFRSTKKMQAVQPRIKEIKEKFKDDPQRLNQETMKLFRENKVNPLGGCLPMLLQLPIFVAFYQVLGQSIELYQAPFAFWIEDLSQKDPYYVLPVLTGAALFLQQKLTPTAMDPTQQKVMMIMPLMFIAFMINFPSGLNLYIFVSTLFGVTQSFVMMKDKRQKVPQLVEM